MSEPIALPSELTIYTLSTLREEWLGWIGKIAKPRKAAAAKPWLLDASRVDEVDAAGVQLLLSLSHSLAAKNRRLQLVNSSTPMVNACHGLGATMLLALDTANTDGNV
jgi:anti-anti-sigma regulatory factor